MGEDQARPALGEIKQDVLKPIRGMSLGAWSGWQDQKRGQGLRRHKQSEWRAGGGLGEQGRGVVGGGGGGPEEAQRLPVSGEPFSSVWPGLSIIGHVLGCLRQV